MKTVDEIRREFFRNYNMICEGWKASHIIEEGKREKSADNKSRQVIRDFFNNIDWLDTEFVHTDNPNHLSNLEYMLKAFKDEFYHNSPMRERPIMGFEPVFCKIAFENGFQQSNPDHIKLNRLKQILLLMDRLSVDGKIDLSKIDKNTVTYETLNEKFGKIIDEENEAQKMERDSKDYVLNEDYEIIGPVDYDEAQEFGEMSCPESRLCYTESETTWSSYTKNGKNDAYILLKKGFEEIPPVNDEGEPAHGSGQGNPYDTYGLSMIFVFISPEGELTNCNTRWNHYAKYTKTDCDHALNKNEISDIIGANFDKFFGVEEKKEAERLKWKRINDDIESRLQNGEDPKHIFNSYDGFKSNGIAKVGLKGKFNFINTEGQFISNQWFDYCSSFEGGFAKVGLNLKWNFINSEGQFISNQWFDGCSNFEDGLAEVVLDRKWNYINTEGQPISDKWFDACYSFNDGFAVVGLNGEYNFINTKGQFISDKWFDGCERFKCGFAEVSLNEKVNFINTEGKLISDQWFDYCCNFEGGFARVEINGKWNFINTEGQIISDQWFDLSSDFKQGFSVVVLDRKRNLINSEGQLISDQWFDDCENFKEDFAMVKLNRKWNFINTEGQIISDQWFNYCSNFEGGFASVVLNGKVNFINTKGQIISHQWFDTCSSFNGGFARVGLNGKTNFINTEGQIISDQWFSYCSNFEGGFSMVNLNGEFNFINTKGQFISDQWFDWCSDFNGDFAEVRLNGKCYRLNLHS